MVQYRRALPQERGAYIEMANRVFTFAGTAINFEEAIPKVYGPDIDSAWMQNIAVDGEGNILGLAAVMPNTLYAGLETLKIGFIGTVSVCPEARGKGYMKNLMRISLEQMCTDETDFALLTGQRQRYEYYGFSKSGIARRAEIVRKNVVHALKDVDVSGIAFEEMGEGSPWIDDAWALYEQRSIRFRRTKDAFIDICRTFRNTPWAILDRGSFAGYLIANGNKDQICEIYTQTLSVYDAAVKAWMKYFDLSRISIEIPDWERIQLRHLGNYAENIETGCNVQALIFHPRRVLEVFLKAKMEYMQLADGILPLKVDGDSFTVSIQNGRIHILDGAVNPIVLNEKEATKFFTCPFDYEGKPNAPWGWFPLPLYAAAPDAF